MLELEVHYFIVWIEIENLEATFICPSLWQPFGRIVHRTVFDVARNFRKLASSSWTIYWTAKFQIKFV